MCFIRHFTCTNRDELQTYLKEQDVTTIIYYPFPLYVQPVFKDLGYKEEELPEIEMTAKEAISLPMYFSLTRVKQEYIVEEVIKFSP